MLITKITTQSMTPRDSGVCGRFSIVLDDILCIHNVQVIAGERGLFVSFPNTGKTKNVDCRKRYSDIVHPTDNDFRQYIQQEVLTKYESELANNG